MSKMLMIVIGHLGKDAVVNDVNGKKAINFSVAHSEKFKNAKGELMTSTTWTDCTIWTDNTNVAQYLKKGQLVCVQGKPSVQAYKGEHGIGASLRLRVDPINGLQLLGAAKKEETNGQANGTAAAAPAASAEPDLLAETLGDHVSDFEGF